MIVVGTTIAPWKCDGIGELAWLENAEAMLAESTFPGGKPIHVRFFAALEHSNADADLDSLPGEEYVPLLDRFAEIERATPAGQGVSCDAWTFRMDTRITHVEPNDRLIRICTGRNMIQEYAQRNRATHVLLLDSDISVPGHSLTKLVELDHPIVAGHIPIYCMDGPGLSYQHQPHIRDIDVRVHWSPAGFLLLNREVFTRVAWNYDLDAGNTDDPAFAKNVKDMLGYDTWVRHDLIGHHLVPPGVPEGIKR